MFCSLQIILHSITLVGYELGTIQEYNARNIFMFLLLFKMDGERFWTKNQTRRRPESRIVACPLNNNGKIIRCGGLRSLVLWIKTIPLRTLPASCVSKLAEIYEMKLGCWGRKIRGNWKHYKWGFWDQR